MAPVPVPVQFAPGIERDNSRLAAKALTDGEWARFDGINVRKIWGFRQINHQLSDISRGLGSFSRSGSTYIHTAGQSKLEQIILNSSGISSGITDRTPTLLTTNANYDWTFATMFDSAVFNDAMVIAHGGANLTSIDNAVETPIWWGRTTASASLVPMALPVNVTAFPVLVSASATTNASPTVTGLSSTATLTYGMGVIGTGIPAGTYITAILGANSITLSANATATGTPSLTFQVGGTSGGVVALYPYLMAYGSNGYVAWNKSGNPNDFWSLGSGSAYVTDQKIVRGMTARGGPGSSPSGLLWSLNALIRVYFQGGTVVFGFDTVSDSISVMSPRSIVEVDGVYYWPGVDRFFSFGGSVAEIPNTLNDNWFFDGINETQRMKTFGIYIARWGEIWWPYPRGTATECTHAVILNLRTKTFYDTVLPNGGRSAGVSSSGTFPYPLMTGVEAYSTSPDKYRLWQHEYGLDEIDGSSTRPIRSYFTTPAITLTTNGQQPANKTTSLVEIEPDLQQVGDMTVTVLKAANARGALATAATETIPGTPANPLQETNKFKVSGRQIYLKFESNTPGGDYQANKTLVHVDADDGRETQ